MIILTLCSYGCKSDKDEFKITDVQFKNNIYINYCQGNAKIFYNKYVIDYI